MPNPPKHLNPRGNPKSDSSNELLEEASPTQTMFSSQSLTGSLFFKLKKCMSKNIKCHILVVK